MSRKPKSLIPSPDTWRWLLRLFGPPRADMHEAYANDMGTGQFDHTTLDDLLRRCVDGKGYVDYAGLARYAGLLDGYLSRVAVVDFAGLARDDKLALLINAYNAATLRLVSITCRSRRCATFPRRPAGRPGAGPWADGP
jgi:hypothetical protein